MGGGAWPFLVGGVICLVKKKGISQKEMLQLHASSLHSTEQYAVVQLLFTNNKVVSEATSAGSGEAFK